MPIFDSEALKTWFQENKRDLPWRDDPSPYQVWISEVMLQQTRVAVVLDYYSRWMQTFPSIESLARAPWEEVLKAWEGLGYYNRARFLHATAKEITEKYHGQIPSDKQILQTLKGFGPYTVGAVLSFAYHQKAAAVDGNVMRVMSRYFDLEEYVGPALHKKVHRIVEEILPEEEPWVVMEGLIELGAGLCGKKPLCSVCPVQEGCQGFFSAKADLLPLKKKKELTLLFRQVVILVCEEDVLVCQREEKEIMAGLYEFPYYSMDKNVDRSLTWQEIQKDIPGIKLEQELPEVTQHFTRFKALLYPILCRIETKIKVEKGVWVQKNDLNKLTFSSGHKKICKYVEDTSESFTYGKF